MELILPPGSGKRLMDQPCRKCGKPLDNWTNWIPEMDDDEKDWHVVKSTADIRGFCENRHEYRISW